MIGEQGRVIAAIAPKDDAPPFARVSRWAITDARLSATLVLTLAAIGRHADANLMAWPGTDALGRALGKTRQAVLKDIAQLEATGYLEVTRSTRPGGGGKALNLYRIVIDMLPPNGWRPRVRGAGQRAPNTGGSHHPSADTSTLATDALTGNARNVTSEVTSSTVAELPPRSDVTGSGRDVTGSRGPMSPLRLHEQTRGTDQGNRPVPITTSYEVAIGRNGVPSSRADFNRARNWAVSAVFAENQSTGIWHGLEHWVIAQAVDAFGRGALHLIGDVDSDRCAIRDLVGGTSNIRPSDHDRHT
jgi:hypothetical protein